MIETFGSKAATLRGLEGRLTTAVVLPQVCFTVAEWREQRIAVLDRITASAWSSGPLIVRSSVRGEDHAESGAAGKFRSVGGVLKSQLFGAVDHVVASYPADDLKHEVFVQPCLQNVTMAGVAFGRDPNSGGRYVVINYDRSGSTDRVTGGTGATSTYVESWDAKGGDPAVAPVVGLVRELADLFKTEWLDIEFAIDGTGQMHLLQVRPLPATARRHELSSAVMTSAMRRIAVRITEANRRHPYLSGNRTVFGVMPDWNPAEIVGVRPRPLALSLYRDLVTDNIWAYQRYKYGYRDVRSFPLVVDFEGLPYVDVRVSFNSFVPRDIKPAVADRLVDYYIEKLIATPVLHDKVEFDIVFSCYTPDLPSRVRVLESAGFESIDIGHVVEVLRRLTNRIIGRRDGLWQEDVARTQVLRKRQRAVLDSSLPDIQKLFWLIEDCKRFGTLPFAGLARCAFIATQILQSMVALDVFSREDYAAFMESLDTISARMGRDLQALSMEQFLGEYGHLRPGTYDITSPRYDEAPERYFDATSSSPRPPVASAFTLSPAKRRAIDSLMHDHGIDYDATSLLAFIKTSIEAREEAKFIFTKSLSDALALIQKIGLRLDLDTDALSFVTIDAVREAVARTTDVGRTLSQAVIEGRERWARAQQLVLPPVIVNPEDVYAFNVLPSQPNFVTQLTATGPVRDAEQQTHGLEDSIVLIRSADPGWDWVLTRGIAGFVTQYGGANSHMAVRAHQLGLPAVIGAGETLFETCRAARRLHIDCRNHQVQVLS